MDDRLLNILEDSGFTSKEAKVYFALLELGQATVTDIADRTELKRSIIYVLLEGLVKRGFAAENKQTKISSFSAADPIKILGHLQTVTTNFKEMLPLFKSVFNKSDSKPVINFFEGKKAVLSVYREINYSENTKFFTSTERIANHLPGEVASWIRGVQAGAFIKNAKHIVPNTKIDYKYAKAVHGYNGNEAKVLKDVNDIEIDLSIYNNKIALTSLSDKLFIVVIESKALYNSLSLMFDLAWKQAKPLK
jgi:HTH-type transcriptional regulator, sugar sensing transcriptional regulator